MKLQKDDISQLIVLYLTGEITSAQKQELDVWMESEANQALFNRLIEKERILAKTMEYDSYDPERAWSKLEKQISVGFPYRKWLSYAAVIMLPFAIASYLFFSIPHRDYPSVLSTAEIKPGSSHAILYLADGQVVDLKKDTTRVIRTKANLVIQKDKESLTIKSQNLEPDFITERNKIITPIGGEHKVVLPDGTIVWLNADSYLEFPSKFSGKERRVFAKGELYFDVQENKSKPFVVETNGMSLKVLGTEFNLRAYDDEDKLVSTLIEGSVEVENILGAKEVLVPGREAVLNRNSNSIKVDDANVESAVAWKNGRFLYDNKRLEDIMIDLARWYDIKVFFNGQSLKEQRFSVDVLRYENINEILELIEGTGEVKFDIKSKVILVK